MWDKDLASNLALRTNALLLGVHKQLVELARRDGFPDSLKRRRQVVGLAIPRNRAGTNLTTGTKNGGKSQRRTNICIA